VAATAGVLVVSLTFRTTPLRPDWPFVDTSLSKYRVCHEIAWAAFRARPLTGVGLENFHRAWSRHYQPTRHDPAYVGDAASKIGTPYDPHGTVQGYLAEAGIPGLLAVAAVAVLVWRRRPRGSPETLGFLVAVGTALFFTDVLTERSTFAVLGLLLSTRPTGATSPDSASHSLANRR
jgi:hypothetical protein